MARRRALSPPQFLSLSFGGLIAVGTLLLSLPLATESGERLAAVDALFTATSAVCVTGLIVVDTPAVFSTFGELVLLVLIQCGGLGYMTLSTSLALLFGRRLSIHERQTLQEGLNLDSLEGIGAFTWTVLKLTLVFEVAGAVLLTLWWYPTLGLGRATYFGIFHAISAFNNAGFALFPDNLIRFRGDLVVNLTIASLIVCGGLGFLVLSELRRVRRWRPLSLHSKLAIALSGLLIVSGTVLILGLESENPRTLGLLTNSERLLAAFFQAVSPRTAGFNTIDIGAMTVPSLFVMMLLMFIGAAPGGTGGGIKVTTFGVTVLALVATVRGRDDPVAFGRRVPAEVVSRAFFISLIAFMVLNVVAGLILIFERAPLLPALFETTSAFGTVGLSMGIAGQVVSMAGGFSVFGKLLLTVMMFMGRVGPLTLAVALAGRRPAPQVRYPEGRVMIG